MRLLNLRALQHASISRPHPGRSLPEGDRSGSFSIPEIRHVSSRDQTELGDHPRVAENRETRFGIAKTRFGIAMRDSNHIPAAAKRSIALPRLRAPKITTPDIHRARSDHVIFVRPALFAPVFVTRGAAATRARSVDLSFIRKTKQRRAQFVAGISIADGNDRCAKGRIARMPYASPYCP